MKSLVVIGKIVYGYKTAFKFIKKFYYNFRNGGNMLNKTHVAGYSQGGIISRGIVETTNHNITTFISLSSPQAGQYGGQLKIVYFFVFFYPV